MRHQCEPLDELHQRVNALESYVVELFEHEMNHFVLQVNGKCKN